MIIIARRVMETLWQIFLTMTRFGPKGFWAGAAIIGSWATIINRFM